MIRLGPPFFVSGQLAGNGPSIFHQTYGKARERASGMMNFVSGLDIAGKSIGYRVAKSLPAHDNKHVKVIWGGNGCAGYC
jgi:hypothetical protein